MWPRTSEKIWVGWTLYNISGKEMRIGDVHRKGDGSLESMSKNTSGGRSSSGPERPKSYGLGGHFTIYHVRK